MKARYFEASVLPKLQACLDDAVAPFPEFRQELCAAILEFFERAFGESGSIDLHGLPPSAGERGEPGDVTLWWRTRGLHYVKSDRLFQSMRFEAGGTTFSFDASRLAHRRANEKRELVFEFRGLAPDGCLAFAVTSSERSRGNQLGEIARAVRQAGAIVDDRSLERAFARFERQTEADYFLCQDAQRILFEQLDRWLFEQLSGTDTGWSTEGLPRLLALRAVARTLVLAVSCFEAELVRLWNKPRFVLRSTYVVTLDRLAARDLDLVERLTAHPSWQIQVAEWQALGLIGAPIGAADLMGRTRSALVTRYRFLPVDTKHFLDLQPEIVALFDELDASLDGRLIQGDNQQAMLALVGKFAGAFQTCCIDPPYNTEENSFSYVDRFNPGAWLTMMEDRLALARRLLRPDGTIFVQVDHHETGTLKLLMDRVFGKENLLNEIIWRIGWVSGFKTQGRRFVRNHETIWGYAMGPDYVFDKEPLAVPRGRLAFSSEDARALENLLAKGARGRVAECKAIVRTADGRPLLYPLATRDGGEPTPYALEDVWNANEYDQLHSIKIMSFSSEKIGDERDRNSTQKPEKLLARLIGAATRPGDLVLDFFCGTGTTLAAAHKLGRRWVGVELSEGAYHKALDRLKTVLAGRSQKGASRLGKRFGEPCGISRAAHWEGGGFFKCYEIEQYEDVLRRSRHDGGEGICAVAPRAQVQQLYPDADLPETLSCLLGKPLERISSDTAWFADGTRIALSGLDPQLLEPLSW